MRLAVLLAAAGFLAACTAYDRGEYRRLIDVVDIGSDPGLDAGADHGAPTDAFDATLDAAACDADAAAANPCATVVPLAGPPVIDGVLECGLALSPIDLNWRGTEPPPVGITASAVAAWRPDGLYVFFSVHKPDRNPAPTSQPIWCGDAAEILVDSDGHFNAPPNYDDPGTRQFILAVPPDDHTSVSQAEIYLSTNFLAAWRSTQYRSYPQPYGYDVEAFVVASDLGLATWSLASGANVGLDLTIDVGLATPDSDASECGGYLRGQFNMHVGGSGCGHPSCDVGAFCTPVLSP
jgi:hypothetical protein